MSMNNDVVFTNGNRMMLISLKSDRQKVSTMFISYGKYGL